MALAVAVPLVCCRSDPPPPPEPTVVTVGVHRVAFRVPDGWLHFDHGREQGFESGLLQMSIADLGPVDGLGYARAIEEAWDLWREGRLEDAREALGRIRLRAAFASVEAWRAFRVHWDVVAQEGDVAPPGELDEAYRSILETVRGLPPPSLEDLAEAALVDLGHDQRRSVAERRPVLIDDRDGMWVDTWDRLSHDYRQRFLFVVSEGHLLVVHTDLGALSEMEEALDALAGSLVFRPDRSS